MGLFLRVKTNTEHNNNIDSKILLDPALFPFSLFLLPELVDCIDVILSTVDLCLTSHRLVHLINHCYMWLVTSGHALHHPCFWSRWKFNQIAVCEPQGNGLTWPTCVFSGGLILTCALIAQLSMRSERQCVILWSRMLTLGFFCFVHSTQNKAQQY